MLRSVASTDFLASLCGYTKYIWLENDECRIDTFEGSSFFFMAIANASRGIEISAGNTGDESCKTSLIAVLTRPTLSSTLHEQNRAKKKERKYIPDTPR